MSGMARQLSIPTSCVKTSEEYSHYYNCGFASSVNETIRYVFSVIDSYARSNEGFYHLDEHLMNDFKKLPNKFPIVLAQPFPIDGRLPFSSIKACRQIRFYRIAGANPLPILEEALKQNVTSMLGPYCEKDEKVTLVFLYAMLGLAAAVILGAALYYKDTITSSLHNCGQPMAQCFRSACCCSCQQSYAKPQAARAFAAQMGQKEVDSKEVDEEMPGQ